jgi:hypothetical protein
MMALTKSFSALSSAVSNPATKKNKSQLVFNYKRGSNQ